MLSRKTIKSCVWAVLVSAAGIRAQAQTGPTDVITTAAPSLRIPVDGRATAMGNVGIGTTADAAAADFNLAKAPFASGVTAVGVNYSPWEHEVASGMYLLGLSGYHRLDTLQAVTASVRYFNLGNFGVKDMNGNVLQSATPNEWSVAAGYSRKLSARFALGLAFRYIRSSLASGSYNGTTYKAGQGVAADLGFYYDGRTAQGAGLTAGLAMSNIGSKIGYTSEAGGKDYLPAALGGGLGYTVVADEENRILLAADVSHLLVPAVPRSASDSADYYSGGVLKGLGKGFGSGAWQYGAGVEYTYKELLSLRAGYYGQSAAAGGQKGFTAGVGLRLSGARVEFSYLAPSDAQSPLKNTVRFGVGFEF